MTVPPTSSSGAQRVPAPLAVALSLVAVEAMVFVGLTVAELLAFESDKALLGVTTSIFFLLYAAGLATCAWATYRLQSWARAPIVLAQLLQLFVAWSFVGGETTWVAVCLGIVAAIALAGIFHPASVAALADPVPDEPGAAS